MSKLEKTMDDIIGLKRGTVVLKKYRHEWAESFEKEKEFLNELLGSTVLDVQHIGSTSVRGLASKPIIDMIIGVNSLRDISHIRPLLENAGYRYRQNGSDGIQILFAKGSPQSRTHYLHITKLGSSVWKNDIAFRDYLRAHPETAAEYAKLKESLAAQYTSDRYSYTAGKEHFIKMVLAKA